MIDFNKIPLFLAPLAGFSDLPLRGVVKKFGADVTISEMISSNALVFESKKTLKMIEKNSLEIPFIVQLAGSDENILKKAVEILNRFDGIDGIDLNCGCPVPKVIKQNAGSALLKDLDKFKILIETIKKYSNKRYTSVKIRLGFDEKIPEILVQNAIEAGVDFISIHCRTRSGMYHSAPDYEAIKRAKDVSSVPIIANGNIDEQNYKDILKTTNANGLMIGRASIGKPWIFYEIKNKKNISKELKKEIILFHFKEMIDYYGVKGISIFRKHLHEYSKGYDNASEFRNEINSLQDPFILEKKILEFF